MHDFFNSKDSKSVVIFTLVVVEFLAMLWFFTNWKLQNMSGNNAANWWQKLSADSPSLDTMISHMIIQVF